MGFFASGGAAATTDRTLPKAETLHRLGCRACPLFGQKGLAHPQMAPTGADKPLVYMLGEAPGEVEDRRGRQFVGPSGTLLRDLIPDDWKASLRWNNIIRTRPPKNRTPEFVEIECCRPSVVADLEASQPVAIFGFGNVPLEWATGRTGIGKWRGRRLPVQVGRHACWFYPMLHPSGLLRQRRNNRISEDERAFEFDLKRALSEVEQLPAPVVHNREYAERGVETVTDCNDRQLDRIAQALMDFRRDDSVGFDWETNKLRPYSKGARILSLAVSNGKRSFAFPLDHSEAHWSATQREKLQTLVLDFMLATPVRKLVHNVQFEMEWAAVKFDKAVLRSSNWECSMQQAVVLDERVGGKGTGGCLSLDFLVRQYFGFDLKVLSNVDRKNLDKEPLAVVLGYNAMDAKYHHALFHAQHERLVSEKLISVYKLAMRNRPATCVLTQMKGVPRDNAVVAELQAKYEDRSSRLEAEIAAMPVVAKYEKRFGKRFNPMSPQDVVRMFRDLQGRKEGFTEKQEERDSGYVRGHLSEAGYSVDKNVLDAIGTPLALTVVELRETNKRKATYLDPLADGADTVYPDGLLHQTLNSTFSMPGRLSSDGPNLQNFPKRDGEAKEVRKCMTAPDGQVYVALDEGQIQARNIAMESKDKAFVKALWERYDVHSEWARRIALAWPDRIGGRQNLTDKKVMKDLRSDTKNQWTFPLFFGAQVKSVAAYLNIPVSVAEALVDEFWKQFYGVRDWHERLRKFYHKHGYVESLVGRRFRAPLSFNEMINYPIQNLEAEIVLDAQTRVSVLESRLWDRSLDRVEAPKSFQRLAAQGTLLFQPNLMVHDDLTYILPAKDVDRYVEPIIGEMLNCPFKFVNVPLTVEMSVGKSWYDLEAVETFSSDTWGKAA